MCFRIHEKKLIIILTCLLISMQAFADGKHDAKVWSEIADQVELSGDWREDIISVARSQLGYSENSDDYVVYDDGVKHYYSLYGDEFGEPYEEWCTYFVGFCIKHAEIDDTLFPFKNSTKYWIDILKYMGAYVDTPYRYDPKPADLVVFSWSGTNHMEHIGIVESVTPGTLNTIEGNKSGTVNRGIYDPYDKAIMAYINLDVLMEKAGVKKPKVISVEKMKGRIIADMVNVRSEPSTGSNRVTMLPIDTEVTIVGYCEKDNGDIWYYVQLGDEVGYVRGDYIDLYC